MTYSTPHIRVVRSIRLIIFLALFVLTAAGCARFSIPPPDAPIKALVVPDIPNSTITLPVSVSVKSMLTDLAEKLTKDPEQNSSGRENRFAGMIQDYLQRRGAKIENNMVQNVYVRQQVQKVWEALQDPIKLREDVSLLLKPQSVSVSPPKEEHESMQIVVGLVAKPEIVAGPAAHAAAPAAGQPLPAITVSSSPPEPGFHIVIANEISFEVIGKEMTKRLANRVFAPGGKSITVQKVRMYGSGESVVLAADIDGSINGTIYFSGKPAYDESTRTLYIRNIQYTLETRQVLAKAADWLMHTDLEKRLAERASWPIGDKIESTRGLLSNGLNRSLNQHVSVNGTIDTIRAVAVGITETGVKAVLAADGKVEMHVF